MHRSYIVAQQQLLLYAIEYNTKFDLLQKYATLGIFASLKLPSVDLGLRGVVTTTAAVPDMEKRKEMGNEGLFEQAKYLVELHIARRWLYAQAEE